MSVWWLVIEHDKTMSTDYFVASCAPGSLVDDLIKDVFENDPVLAGINTSLVSAYHSAPITAELKHAQSQSAISELDLDQASANRKDIVTDIVSGYELLIFKLPAPPAHRECYSA